MYMKYDSFLCETVFHMFYIYPTLWVFHYTVEHMGQSRGSKEKARWLFIHSKNVMKRGTYSLFMLKCFLIFFLQRPEGKINYYNHADTTYNLSATCQQKLLKHLMFISGRVDIFSPKIWTQDNIDDQTHRNTKQLICNNIWHLNVSKSRRGFILSFSPPVI